MHATICPPVRYISNARDLGGWDTPFGPTQPHRYLRCGSTSSATQGDLDVLRDWGVRHDIDLRGLAESPRQTDRLANQDWVRWVNVPFYDINISSDPLLPATYKDNYLVNSYLTMLSSQVAVRACIRNAGIAAPDECVLFHCAAGMDRTGMLSLLLLGAAGVSRDDICTDYCLSFAKPDQIAQALALEHERGAIEVVDRRSDFTAYILSVRLQAICVVCDTIIEHHGTVTDFLHSSGVTEEEVEAVRSHLLEP